MIWLMTAYFLGLLYFAANPGRIVRRGRFRLAWILFAVVPIISGLFTLLRCFAVGYARASAVLEIISTGLSWILLGLSLCVALGAVLPADRERDGNAG